MIAPNNPPEPPLETKEQAIQKGLQASIYAGHLTTQRAAVLLHQWTTPTVKEIPRVDPL